MKELFIIRGVCGAGKTTFAKKLCGNHYETDMYFMDGDKYIFDRLKLKEAHSWCNDTVKKDMENNVERIVISNTFTQEWEMLPYITIANDYGYTIFSVIVENRHNGVNVPEEIVEKMKNRFEISL